MELEQLVSSVKEAGISLGALNGKLLVVDPTRRLGDDLYDLLDDHNDELVHLFARKTRRQDAFWRGALGEQFSATPLLDGRALARQGDRGTGVARLTLAPQVRADLHATGVAESVFGLAWAWLLSRYSLCREVHWFCATSSRSMGLSGIADKKGMIVNLRPSSVTLNGADDLCAVLDAMAARHEQESSHGAPAFTDRNKFGGRAFPFDALLVLDQTDTPASCEGMELCSLANVDADGLHAILIATDDHASKTVTIELQHDRAFLSDEAAAALLRHFNSALSQLALAKAAGKALCGIDMVSGTDRAALLALGSGGGKPAAAACMHEAFEQAAAAAPQRTAVLWRGQEIRYAELNGKANRLARRLLAEREAPGEVIGICMARTPELIVAMLAVLKAGCAYVPLDPAYPQSRRDFMLDDSAARIVVADAALAPGLAAEGRIVIGFGEGTPAAPPAGNIGAEESGAHAASLAYVIYTSGSTGVPKGVMIDHGAAVSFLQWARSQFSEQQLRSVLCSTSICFDLSIFEIFLPLSVGTRLVLADNILDAFDGENVPDVSLINSVPSAVAELVESRRIPASVGTVCLAGEPLRRKLVDRIYEHDTVQAVYNLYGPSEYTTYATFAVLGRDDAREPRIGRPLQGAQALVLDSGGCLAPRGVKGELFIGGPGISRGYINRPALTAEKFVVSRFAGAGATLYRTGDFVRWGGNDELEFIGRADDQVKLRGFRVELGEIEARLNAMDMIASAAVVVRDDEAGEQCLAAYVALEAGAARDNGAGPARAVLRDMLKKSLSADLPAHMVPDVYVVLPELPLTLNGKIDRKRLAQPGCADLQASQYCAPRNDTERELCAHFQKLLGVARVGIHDDFFAMGGHSLLVFRLVILVRGAFHIDLPLKAVFESPTVAQLAALIGAPTAATAQRAIVPVARDTRMPASFAQQRFWFLYRMDPASAEYNLPLAFALRGAFALAACQRALDSLIERHEVLRTTLHEIDGNVVQRIGAAQPAAITVLDLSHLAPGAAALEARAWFERDLRTPFRLDSDAPVRFRVARLGDDEHHVQFNVHHVATDGWSVTVMLREFAELYDFHAHGKAHALPELPLQYADFARWQRDCLDGEALDALRAQWKRTLDNCPRLHSLPLDRPRPALQKGTGKGARFAIDARLLAAFKARCAAQGATLFMGLQTIYAGLLGRWSECSDIVMGTPVAGRTVGEVEPLIGCFMNNVTLRNRIARDASFATMLAEARQMILDALAGQEFPFEALVSELDLRHDASHQPLFQAWFVLQSQSAEYPVMQALEVGPLAPRDDRRTVHFDISLNATEVDEHLEMLWEYQDDLFDESTIGWLSECFTLLVQRAVTEPDAVLLAAALPAPAAPTARTPADPAGFLARFAPQVARNPDAVAAHDGSKRISYAGLDASAGRVAACLAAQDIGPNHTVLVQLEHGIELLIAMLAIVKRGAAYAIVAPGADPLALALNHPEVAGCFLPQDKLVQGGVHCWSVRQALDAGRVLPAQDARYADRVDAALRVAHVGADGLSTAAVDSGRLFQHLLAQADACALSEASSLLVLPQTLGFAPFEWLLGLSIGASLVLAAAPGAATHMSLTPGLLAALDPSHASRLASIVLCGDACASALAWDWAARCKVFHAFGSRDLPFIACEPVVPGRRLTLGAMTVPGSALLLDEYGHDCPWGMPARLQLNLGSTRRETAARLRRLRDGRHVLAGPRIAVRGFDLDLAELEERIGAFELVTGVLLQACGNRLVAIVAADVEAGQRRQFGAALRQALQAALPLYAQPDALVLVGSLALDAKGRRSRAMLSLPPPASEPPAGELRVRPSGAEAWTDMTALLAAFGALMALEQGTDDICLSAASLDTALPLTFMDGQVRMDAPAMRYNLAGEALLAAVARGGAACQSVQAQLLVVPGTGPCITPDEVAFCAPLRLTVARHDGQPCLEWRYRTDRYTHEKVAALSRRLQRLVDLLAADAGTTLAGLDQKLDADVKGRIMGLKNRFALNNH